MSDKIKLQLIARVPGKNGEEIVVCGCFAMEGDWMPLDIRDAPADTHPVAVHSMGIHGPNGMCDLMINMRVNDLRWKREEAA
jgi:hypothetical protein